MKISNSYEVSETNDLNPFVISDNLEVAYEQLSWFIKDLELYSSADLDKLSLSLNDFLEKHEAVLEELELLWNLNQTEYENWFERKGHEKLWKTLKRSIQLKYWIHQRRITLYTDPHEMKQIRSMRSDKEIVAMLLTWNLSISEVYPKIYSSLKEPNVVTWENSVNHETIIDVLVAYPTQIEKKWKKESLLKELMKFKSDLIFMNLLP